MNTKNTVLMRNARTSLKGVWGINIGAAAIYITWVSLSIPPFGLIQLVLTGPLALGFVMFSLNVARKKKVTITTIFKGFNTFGSSVGVFLLPFLYIILWGLLLIIPGIMAAYSYGMVFYILADDKSLSITAAIQESKKIMYGNKLRLFNLELRFLGWFILSILTCGILFLWTIPYLYVSIANFYDDIKDTPKDISKDVPKTVLSTGTTGKGKSKTKPKN